MAVTPNTILYLLKSPLELDNKNQLTFATEKAQLEYFLSLPKLEVDRISYQRKDSTIRFPAHIDSLIGYNYVMYQNENYTNKWFYAYITNMRYENDGMTTITIETDCYQTWMFDIDIKKSFVVREHVSNDTVGLHTVPEGLEKGTMIQTNMTPITYLTTLVDGGNDSPVDSLIIIGSTRDLGSTSYPKLFGEDLYGCYSGCSYYAMMNASSANIVLRIMAEAGYIDDIVSVFMAPKKLVLPSDSTAFSDITTTYGTYYYYKINSVASDRFRTITYTINKPTSIDGYTPTNKKLLTGEFNSLNVTNYVGENMNYRYEYFKTNNCVFRMRGTIGPGCSINMYPDNYVSGGTDTGYTAGCYSINAPKIPLCNWNSDQYTNWLASTSGSRFMSLITSGAEVVAGAALIASGAGALVGGGLIAGGIGGIVNQATSQYDHSHDANANNGSQSASDINYSNSKVFGAYQYCIRAEYARKIDGIFSAIGYKVNEMKIPNVTGRLNWNYVQTMEVAIQGTIPQEDLQTIKDMFNSGVTFWHNPSTFLDYSQNNGII